MSSAPTPDIIARDATWLVQAVDPARGDARLIAMSRESYRAASFLDDRLLQQPVDSQVVPWTTVEEAASLIDRADARWIFHIGHVGSTLVSRLLGEVPGVLSIREPRLLRDLALSPAPVRERYVAAGPRLMSRAFDASEHACVKATSFVSEIAPELVPPGEPALFMFATPANYLGTILAGENSVRELQILAPARAARMAARVTGLDMPQQSLAHLAAAAWACEVTALEQAAEQMPDRQVSWLDFDSMLEALPDSLFRTLQHFCFDAEPRLVEAIARGPLMQRYSKAVEFDYSPSLRRQLIDDATANHRDDIEAALAMLYSAAEKSPLLARALARAES